MYFESLGITYSIPIIVLFKTGAHRLSQTSELQGENLDVLDIIKLWIHLDKISYVGFYPKVGVSNVFL